MTLEDQYKPIITTRGSGVPHITVVGCMHGTEKVGKRIIDKLANITLRKGTLITIIAHPYALKKNKRYIDTDLNRCFPGNRSGNIEERLAYYLRPYLQHTDYVIDIHSTTTDTTDVAIIKTYDNRMKELVNILSPRRVLHMKENYGNGSLINHSHLGISLEYGKDSSLHTYRQSLHSIYSLLEHLNMIPKRNHVATKKEPTYYSVFDVTPKPKGFVIEKNIKNFKLVKKGSLLGTANKKPIYAQEDFYPVLFDEDNYKDILGFKAHKKSQTDV